MCDMNGRTVFTLFIICKGIALRSDQQGNCQDRRRRGSRASRRMFIASLPRRLMTLRQRQASRCIRIARNQATDATRTSS